MGPLPASRPLGFRSTRPRPRPTHSTPAAGRLARPRLPRFACAYPMASTAGRRPRPAPPYPPSKVACEQGDAADVGVDGAGAVVAALQVLGEALTQGGHEGLPWGRVHAPAVDVGATMPRRASKRKTSFRKGRGDDRAPG